MHSHGTGPVEDKVLSGETSFGVFVAIGTLVFAGLFLLAEQAGLSRHFSYLAAAILLVTGIAVPALQARTMSTADWMVARGSVNRVVAAMALAASLIAGWMLPVAVGQFFAGSQLAIVWVIAPLLALAIGAFAITPFLKQTGAATPGDLIARRFDMPAARFAYGGVAAAAGILLLWSQLRFAGLLGGLLFPVEPETAILIASSLAALVVLLGVDHGDGGRGVHQRHGVAAAAAVEQLDDVGGHAVTGALLIDIGLPLMALAHPEDHARLRDFCEHTGTPLVDEERRRFGATHADAGALLARRWSLPFALSDMIAGHHFIPRAAERDDRALGFVAHFLAQQGDARDPWEPDLTGHVPSWVTEAAQQVALRH